MIRAARTGKPSNNRSALTDDQVREVRRRLAENDRPTMLAKELGVSKNVIYMLRKGKSYKRVT